MWTQFDPISPIDDVKNVGEATAENVKTPGRLLGLDYLSDDVVDSARGMHVLFGKINDR